MEPGCVAEEMGCMNSGNGREETDGGNGQKEMECMDGGNGREEMDGGNGEEEVDAVHGGNGGKTGGKCRRAKHKCPYTACNASVIHLPRHMKQLHGWNKTDSSGVLGTFDLRKGKPSVKKREHPRKVCPKIECGAIVRRIHNHLAQVHKIKRGSPQYLKLVEKAENYLPPEDNISSSDESLVDSSDYDQLGTLRNMKNPSSSRNVYESVYDSEDSADYKRFLNSVVKSGDKKCDKDDDNRSHDEGKYGGDGDSDDEDDLIIPAPVHLEPLSSPPTSPKPLNPSPDLFSSPDSLPDLPPRSNHPSEPSSASPVVQPISPRTPDSLDPKNARVITCTTPPRQPSLSPKSPECIVVDEIEDPEVKRDRENREESLRVLRSVFHKAEALAFKWSLAEEGEGEGSQTSSSSTGFVPPSSRSRGGQERLITDSELVQFRELFAAYINSTKPITTKTAISMLKGNSNLRHLVKKCTPQQIYDKLRTERKIALKSKGHR
ncbi:Hypothetical predicted protein [Paramuricea clavata]|uniref:Uncharacterized protein n=1 Tax=Paramuricea clavata TaxID=317549 RepID=A0A6S7GVH1_PARCT|nr:Hypothetical predicted protein [Paramuricea clavata]